MNMNPSHEPHIQEPQQKQFKFQWTHLLNNVKKMRQTFDQTLDQTTDKFEQYLDIKVNSTNELIAYHQLCINNIKVNKQHAQAELIKKKQQSKNIKLSLDCINIAIAGLQTDITHQKQLNQLSQSIFHSLGQTYNKHIKIFNQNQQKKLVLKQKYNRKKQSFADDQKNNLFDKSFIRGRGYEARKPVWGQRRYSTSADAYNKFLPIQIIPEKNTLIFRVKGSGGKLFEFYLYFDEEEGKFILKNPYKSLNLEDTSAVKRYNTHLEDQTLLRELKWLINEFVESDF